MNIDDNIAHMKWVQRVGDLCDKLSSYFASGSVKRWHTAPMLRVQTDGEHSARALTLLLLLYPIGVGREPALELIKAVLWHDNAERVVGDVPAPVLRAHDEYREMYHRLEKAFFTAEQGDVSNALADLDDLQLAWLKAVDRLELIIFCREEEWLGNQHAKIVADRCTKYVLDAVDTPEIVVDMAKYLQNHHNLRSFA